MGGTLFAQQQYPAALAKFSKALRYINVHPVLPDTHDAKAKPDFAAEYLRLKAVLYSNSAFCALKIADATPASAAGEVKAHARQAEEAAGNAVFVIETYRVPPKDGAAAAAAAPPKDDADLAKAYYRRALARSKLADYEGAGSDLIDAAKLAPNDAGIKREKAKLEETRRAQKEKQRRQYAKMFG